MNRQELRRNKRKKITSYNLTADQLATIQTQAEDKALKEVQSNLNEILKEKALETFTQGFYIPLLVLRNMGWGKKRLTQFAQDMIKQQEMFEEDYFNSEDVKEMLFDEAGIRLDFELNYKEKKTEIKLTTSAK